MSLIIASTLFTIGTAKAAVLYPEYHPQDLINDESLYSEVDALTIEGNETQILNQINFSNFTKLKEINLHKTVVLNGSILNLDKPINKLHIVDSVVNISSFDLNDFDNVWIGVTYNVGEKISDAKITYWNFLNEEYRREYPYYGSEYENELNEIAMNIYESSNKTPQDIIRLVTLYVVENMQYDEPTGETSLEILLKDKKGVCVNYAEFESILLNKLGVFALALTGSYNIFSNQNQTIGHAWNVVYTDGAWYYIDPTWLDDEKSIATLRNGNLDTPTDNTSDNEEYANWLQNPLKYYMQDINNPYFNSQHQPEFTTFELIPESERVSKMSIISNIDKDEKKDNKIIIDEIAANTTATDTTTADEATAEETIKVPNTGSSTFADKGLIAGISAAALAVTTVIFYISHYVTKRHHAKTHFGKK